jgi:hypothetical protein
LRCLAKSYGLLGAVLNYESEGKTHVEFAYGNVSAKRGNFILPFGEMQNPTISIQGAEKEKFYSAVLIDADVPLKESNCRAQLILWAKYDPYVPCLLQL